MISYYNGSFLEEKDITISPFVGGFEFGKGVFTTLKYENKQFFNLDKHLKRLFNSCKVFEIKWHTINFPVILSELMDRNDLTGSRIKIIVFDENLLMAKELINWFIDIKPCLIFTICISTILLKNMDLTTVYILIVKIGFWKVLLLISFLLRIIKFSHLLQNYLCSRESFGGNCFREEIFIIIK